jgi:hypothetical protein
MKWLTELQPTQGYGNIERNATINGRVFDVAILQKASGAGQSDTMVYRNGGDRNDRYDIFEVWVGVKGGNPKAVKFSILGDGEELYTSRWIDQNTPAIKISLPVRQYSGISLIVSSRNDSERWHRDHELYWANPVFIREVRDAPPPSRPGRSTPSYGGGGIRVIVDGTPVNFGHVSPSIRNGRVLVPMRPIFEALGAQVEWNAATQSIRALVNGKSVILRLTARTAVVDGRIVRLEVPAQSWGGRTMVPLRFIAEASGAKVTWNPETSTAEITNP